MSPAGDWFDCLLSCPTVEDCPEMEQNDWESRYQGKDTPWEKGEPAPGLVDFLDRNPLLAKGQVAVPGCGTGHDARTWARGGFDVFGADFAPSAIRLCEERTRAAGLQIRFARQDFLADDPPGQFDWLFEHTLFCAIQPDRRPDYVAAARRWLKPGGQFLAIHYMIRDTDGPPFGTTQPELMELFTPHFELLEGWVPRSYPNRVGLELMLWWRKKL